MMCATAAVVLTINIINPLIHINMYLLTDPQRTMLYDIPSDWVMELPDIRRAIHHLVKDSNPDVRHFVSFLPPILRNDLCQEEKARA